MLTPYLPYPLYSGGQIRTYNLLKSLARKHEITLFSFIREEEERKYLPQLEKYLKKIVLFKRRPAWDLKNILLAGFTPFPFVMIATYMSLSVRKKIAWELKHHNYDLIHAEPFYMTPNIPKTNIPILLVEQTIEYLVYKKYVDDFKLSFLKAFMYFDVLKLKFWEEYFWKKATRLVAMSKQDKKIMGRAVPKKPIDVIANGVDIDFFASLKRKKCKQPTVLFVGNFKWLPNKDAAQFLTFKIWPKIKKQVSEAKLWIVGKNPTEKIKSLSNQKGVKVEDGIEDIRDAFGNASVLLAPIRNGRGTKYKVLEAMASKLPVVATPLGVEGVEVENGKQALVARSAEGLADHAVRVLQDEAFSRKIANSAFKVIKEKYNWKQIAENLDKIYKQLGEKEN